MKASYTIKNIQNDSYNDVQVEVLFDINGESILDNITIHSTNPETIKEELDKICHRRLSEIQNKKNLISLIGYTNTIIMT